MHHSVNRADNEAKRSSSSSASRSTVSTGNEVITSHRKAGSLLQNSPKPQKNPNKTCCSQRCWKVESRGAVLVLFWNFSIWTAGSLVYDLNVKTVENRSLHDFQANVLNILYFVCCLFLWLFGTPLTGWLADSKFGRYKVIRTGFWLMWIGRIIHAVCEVITHSTDNSSFKFFLEIVILFGAVLFFGGGVGFLANAVQFGIDQMAGASVSEVTSFIYWFVFSLNAGIWISQSVRSILHSCVGVEYFAIVEAVLPVLMVSLAISSDFLFHSWLTIEPQSENPFKSIYKVLRFTVKNKHLRRRSAFTYWEDEIPRRIDFGKMKYGGPFTTEEVEDVKTFLHILVLMAPVCVFLVSTFLSDFSVSENRNHYTHSKRFSKCEETLISALVYDRSLLRMMYIAIYEFLICPFKISRCLHRAFGSILRRLGIVAVLSVILGIFLLVLDIIGHAVTKDEVPCMFENERNTSTIAINFFAVDVSTTAILSLQTLLYTTASLELICAQAPYSMRGLLIGFAWSTYAVSLALSNAISESWRAGWKWNLEGSHITCGFVYYFFTTTVGVVGLVAYCVVARWYKPRIRQEPANQQSLVEEIFDRRCSQYTRRDSIGSHDLM